MTITGTCMSYNGNTINKNGWRTGNPFEGKARIFSCRTAFNLIFIIHQTNRTANRCGASILFDLCRTTPPCGHLIKLDPVKRYPIFSPKNRIDKCYKLAKSIKITLRINLIPSSFVAHNSCSRHGNHSSGKSRQCRT